MSIRILVKSSTVHTKAGNAKGSGKPYSIREQAAALDTGLDFPDPIRIALNNDQPPYAPGVYTLSPDSFKAGAYGAIEVSRYPRLVPDTTASVAAKKVA